MTDTGEQEQVSISHMARKIIQIVVTVNRLFSVSIGFNYLESADEGKYRPVVFIAHTTRGIIKILMRGK